MFFRISSFFFFYFAFVGVYVIFMPSILSKLHYTSLEIGIIFSTAPLVRFLLPFVIKRYFTFSIKIFLIALILLILSGFSFYFTIQNFWLFLLSNIPFGATMGLTLPFVESYAMESLQKERYGKARLFGSLGFISASLILAKILKTPFDGINFFFISICISSIFGFSIAYNNPSFSPLRKKIKSSINLIKHARFWISLTLIQISFGAFYNFFTIYQGEHGVSLSTISFLWSFGVVCEILFFYFQGVVLKRFSMLTLIRFATLITTLRWLLLYFFPSSLTITFFAQSLHAISFALLHSAAFLHLQTLYKDKKLSSQFYFGITFGLGTFMGSIVAGLTYGTDIYLISAFIAFIAFLTCKNLR